jgi:hypothetical protein
MVSVLRGAYEWDSSRPSDSVHVERAQHNVQVASQPYAASCCFLLPRNGVEYLLFHSVISFSVKYEHVV